MITRRHTSAIRTFGTLEWFGWDGSEMVLLATIGGGPRIPHTQFKRALFQQFGENITFTGNDASLPENPDSQPKQPAENRPRWYTYVIRVNVRGSTLQTLAKTANDIAQLLAEARQQLAFAIIEVTQAPTNEDAPRIVGVC